MIDSQLVMKVLKCPIGVPLLLTNNVGTKSAVESIPNGPGNRRVPWLYVCTSQLHLCSSTLHCSSQASDNNFFGSLESVLEVQARARCEENKVIMHPPRGQKGRGIAPIGATRGVH